MSGNNDKWTRKQFQIITKANQLENQVFVISLFDLDSFFTGWWVYTSGSKSTVFCHIITLSLVTKDYNSPFRRRATHLYWNSLLLHAMWVMGGASFVQVWSLLNHKHCAIQRNGTVMFLCAPLGLLKPGKARRAPPNRDPSNYSFQLWHPKAPGLTFDGNSIANERDLLCNIYQR